ncbi:MAG: hypothetical protein HZA59_04995 [Hydrogenophilales bacterium]|nr:hypothetical protein [Hydrogenophilales bacterium]
MKLNPIQYLIFAAAFVLSTVTWSQSMTDTYTKPEGWNTWCIGRFLIDLPPTAKYAGGRSKYDFYDIETPNEAFAAFIQRIDVVEQKLRAQHHQTEPSMIKELIKFNDNGSRGFIYFTFPHRSDRLKSEAYLWKRTGFTFGGTVSIDRVSVASSRIKALAQTLTPRNSNEIPAGPGFCINQGFIPDDGEKHESADAGFKLSDKPDVFINLSTITKTPGPTLLERQGGALGMLGALVSKARKLREGERIVSGLAGQESLIRAPNEGGHMAHLFAWETQGKDQSSYPFIELELQTGRADKNGNEQPASLTDKQALALWDQILASLRLRPTTPGKTSNAGDSPNDGNSPATPKRLPLKSKITSASNCPQTGIWECAADSPGITAHRRFIEAGRPMPYGLTQRPAKGLGGFLGKQEDEAVDITWTLVAYDKDAS